MSLLARAAYAAAAALAVLFAPAGGRAELTPSKPKNVFLDASFESVVSGGEEEVLFLESIALKGKPSCVRVRSRVTFDGESVELTRSIRLRCGQSDLVQDILPGLPCEARDYPLHLEVEVEGVPGIREVDVDLRGGQRPGEGRPVCNAEG